MQYVPGTQDDIHPLCLAVVLSDMSMIGLLLKNHASLTVGGDCSLLTAISANKIENFHTLLKGKNTPFFQIILDDMLWECEHIEAIEAMQKLIESSCPHVEPIRPTNLLHKSLDFKHESILSWLLERGMAPDTGLDSMFEAYEKEPHYVPPLLISQKKRKHGEVLFNSVRDNDLCDIDSCDVESGTPLYAALQENDRELMMRLLDSGACIYQPTWVMHYDWWKPDYCQLTHEVARNGDVE